MSSYPFVILLHAAAFLLFWLTNGAFYAETNNFLADQIGPRLDYIRMCLVFAAALAAWSGWRLRAGSPRSVMGKWAFAIAGVLFLLFFYGSFVVLFQQSESQKPRLLYLISYFRLLPDTALLLSAAWWAGAQARRRGWTIKKASLLLLGLAAAWGLGLVFPPANVYRGALPPKPLLIAHRGASLLAPENTLASARKAVELGAYGLETDVRVSQDGQLFLMHDESLKRTTNAAQVYPGRPLRAETFTRAELDALSAGSWFRQAGAFTQEKIPSFEEWLGVASVGGNVIIFDLEQPPAGHAYPAEVLYEKAFQQISLAGLDAQTWFLVSPQQAAALQTQAPLIKRAAGVGNPPPPASDLLAQGYQIVNAEFTLPARQIRAYQAAGLWVNLWTVDEPWLFSRTWVQEVDSTTTNNLQALTVLQAPLFGLPFTVYALLWLAAGFLAAGLFWRAAFRRAVPGLRGPLSQPGA